LEINVQNHREGFTLVELLIVIAIIGVLASVLIPQLLGARTAANKRAVQIHSGNVYKAITAIYSETPSIDMVALAAEVEGKCLAPTTVLSVSSITYRYGWSAPPVGAVLCTVLPLPSKNTFEVKITASGVADNIISINGNNPS
jgi:type IV pilus assembly protein PilA